MTWSHAEPGTHPTNNILVEFEIQWKFVMLFIITHSADHKEILHTHDSNNSFDQLSTS